MNGTDPGARGFCSGRWSFELGNAKQEEDYSRDLMALKVYYVHTSAAFIFVVCIKVFVFNYKMSFSEKLTILISFEIMILLK